MALGGIWPERAGNRRPFDHPGLQGEEREEPLGRPGNPQGAAIPEQGESPSTLTMKAPSEPDRYSNLSMNPRQLEVGNPLQTQGMKLPRPGQYH